MKSPRYRIAFFDIDGTITMEDRSIPASAAKAIQQLKQQGCTVVISTGRSLFAIVRAVRDLEPDYYIVAGGAAVYDAGENLILRRTIGEDDFLKLIREYGENEDCGLVLKYLSGTVSVYNDQKLNTFFSTFGTGQHRSIVYVDPQTELPASGTIFTEDTIEQIKAKFPDLDVTSPLTGYYDVTNCLATKGTAARHIMEMLEVERKDTIAFGDGENDIDLFRCTGFSVAMGNSDDQVKRQADYVTDDIRSDGLAKAINRLCLGGTL